MTCNRRDIFTSIFVLNTNAFLETYNCNANSLEQMTFNIFPRFACAKLCEKLFFIYIQIIIIYKCTIFC